MLWGSVCSFPHSGRNGSWGTVMPDRVAWYCLGVWGSELSLVSLRRREGLSPLILCLSMEGRKGE